MLISGCEIRGRTCDDVWCWCCAQLTSILGRSEEDLAGCGIFFGGCWTWSSVASIKAEIYKKDELSLRKSQNSNRKAKISVRLLTHQSRFLTNIPRNFSTPRNDQNGFLQHLSSHTRPRSPLERSPTPKTGPLRLRILHRSPD